MENQFADGGDPKEDRTIIGIFSKFDQGFEQRTCLIRMSQNCLSCVELLPGEALAETRDMSIPFAETLKLCRQLCDALIGWLRSSVGFPLSSYSLIVTAASNWS